MKKWLVLVGFIAAAQMAGVIGSLFTLPAIDTWYAALARPAVSPPAWVFGPVWTTLYTLMGIAAFLVWRRGFEKREVRHALGIYAAQLALNAAWSYVFFGRQSPGGAFLVIVLLWVAIVATIVSFARVSKPAAWLLAPYLLWVSFAGYLNYAIWMLNA